MQRVGTMYPLLVCSCAWGVFNVLYYKLIALLLFCFSKESVGWSGCFLWHKEACAMGCINFLVWSPAREDGYWTGRILNDGQCNTFCLFPEPLGFSRTVRFGSYGTNFPSVRPSVRTQIMLVKSVTIWPLFTPHSTVRVCRAAGPFLDFICIYDIFSFLLATEKFPVFF